MSTMISIVRPVWSLMLALSLLMIGNGLQGSLLGLRAGVEGFSSSITGLVMSAYYAGFLLSSFITPRLITAVGHVRVFSALASISSTTVLLHALFPDPVLWVVLRLLTGFSLAGLYVVSESWLNGAATDRTRGRLLSFYMLNMSLCMAAGQYVLAFTNPANVGPFVLISVLVSFAVVPIALAPSPQPGMDEPGRMSFLELYHHSPMGFVACLLSGVGGGAFMSMGAVYGDLIGLTTGQIAILLSLPLFAVIATQMPLGVLSDKLDRRSVIAIVSAVVALTAIVALITGPEQFALLAICFTVYGALSIPIYSLAVAHANDNLPNSLMLAASARLIFVYGIGSVVGPFLVGALMQFGGAAWFFVFGAVIHAGLLLFALYRMTKRAAPKPEERGEFVPFGPRPTPVAAIAAIEEAVTHPHPGNETR